jgi:nucleoid DNA-binding protein
MLNKHAFIDRVKDNLKTKYTAKELTEIIETYNDLILEALSSGEEVFMSGFGRFYVKVSKPRIIKNPGIVWMQGKDFKSKEKLKIGFRPSSAANGTLTKLHTDLVEKTKGQY